jgi:hypothetical protein
MEADLDRAVMETARAEASAGGNANRIANPSGEMLLNKQIMLTEGRITPML